MSRLFLFFLITGFLGAFVAYKKGRNVIIWFVVCFLFPILLLLLAILPPQVTQGRTKRCPHCEQVIGENDLSCRYCKTELPINMVKCQACGMVVRETDICSNCGKPLIS